MTADSYGDDDVGGGAPGRIVGARLREVPAVSVCRLEAGPSEVADDATLIVNRWRQLDWLPSRYPWLLDYGCDWDYSVEPQEKADDITGTMTAEEAADLIKPASSTEDASLGESIGSR